MATSDLRYNNGVEYTDSLILLCQNQFTQYFGRVENVLNPVLISVRFN